MADNESAAVPEGAKQAEEVRRMAVWAEPTVWTTRMLTALVDGVKGGCWFSLFDKVYAERNLGAAFERVRVNKGAPGADQQTIEQFERHYRSNLDALQKTLRDGTYRPKPVKRVQIPKPGSKETRPLGIPTVRDRVVQTAVRNVLGRRSRRCVRVRQAVARMRMTAPRFRSCMESVRLPRARAHPRGSRTAGVQVPSERRHSRTAG